jgi:O-antigen/teichoic acid export membrane protein
MKAKREQQYRKIELVGKYKNFLVYDIWGAFINNLSWMIIPILMNSYYGSYSAGQYSIGMRVIWIPMNIIGASISQVYFSTASKKKFSKEMYSYILYTIKKLALFTLPVGLFLLFFSKALFTILFGNNWNIAGIYTQILAPWAIVWLITSPVSQTYAILGKQNIGLILSALNLLTRIISLYIGKLYNNQYIGLILFSFSGIIIYLLILYNNISFAKLNDYRSI